MKTRKGSRYAFTTLALFLLLSTFAAAAPPEQTCTIPQPFSILCPGLDALQSFAGDVWSASEAQPDGAPTEGEAPQAPPGGGEQVGPGSGTTEVGPFIDPQG